MFQLATKTAFKGLNPTAVVELTIIGSMNGMADTEDEHAISDSPWLMKCAFN
jgi:hypothetical protein